MARPKIEFTDREWKDIDEMLQAGMSGRSIADQLGICFDTLSDRIQKRYEADFSTVQRIKKERGTDLLKLTAFRQARDGLNTSLLIFLLKTRAGYKEGGSDNDDDGLDDLLFQGWKDYKPKPFIPPVKEKTIL